MEKIKLFVASEKGKDILVIFIVILVGLASFELGRLSRDKQGSGVKIGYSNQTINQEANALSSNNHSNILQNDKIEKNPNTNGKNFFASSRGSKYYPIGCTGGQNIKQENRIYFNTSTIAEQAGYVLSSSCK
jgi:hypothetical protein